MKDIYFATKIYYYAKIWANFNYVIIFDKKQEERKGKFIFILMNIYGNLLNVYHLLRLFIKEKYI